MSAIGRKRTLGALLGALCTQLDSSSDFVMVITKTELYFSPQKKREL